MDDIQKLQDIVAIVQQQRDSAADAFALAQADDFSLRRTLAERDATIKRLTEQVASQVSVAPLARPATGH